jgi:hypothetical protein
MPTTDHCGNRHSSRWPEPRGVNPAAGRRLTIQLLPGDASSGPTAPLLGQSRLTVVHPAKPYRSLTISRLRRPTHASLRKLGASTDAGPPMDRLA